MLESTYTNGTGQIRYKPSLSEKECGWVLFNKRNNC